ncbi:MAG: hypothetical protein GX089_14305 [Fibrobacter sp.]|jgi:hypothetical protein|nr:hypothetical protein [Fibrobacter sp.]
MVLAIIGLILFLVLIILAIRVGLNKSESEQEEIQNPIIHASGIYSIVRRSPRDGLLNIRPGIEELRKYLSSLNEDIGKFLLSEKDKELILSQWEQTMANSLEVIEQGDNEGVEFYYYDFFPEDCPECKKFLNKGQFVTREEIFKFPDIIPPFHLGCTTCIRPHHGKEKLTDTTESGMLPFFKGEELPPLPDWKTTIKINALWGTSA